MSCSCVNNIVNCRPCYCGCGHNCMCQCCTPITTQLISTTTTICENGEPCVEAVDPNCIIYCGPDLPCYGIKTGDSAADILQVILDFFGPNCPTTTTTSTTTTSTTTTSTTSTTSTSTTTTTTVDPCSCITFTNSGDDPLTAAYTPCGPGFGLVLVPANNSINVCGSNPIIDNPDLSYSIGAPCISFGQQFFCDGVIPECCTLNFSRLPDSPGIIYVDYVDCSGNWVYLEFGADEPVNGQVCILNADGLYYLTGPVIGFIDCPCNITTTTTVPCESIEVTYVSDPSGNNAFSFIFCDGSEPPGGYVQITGGTYNACIKQGSFQILNGSPIVVYGSC